MSQSNDAEDYAGLPAADPGEVKLPSYTVLEQGSRYELVRNDLTQAQGLHCLQCGNISYNANDIRFRFCGFCHEFLHKRDSLAQPNGGIER